jgi:polyphosphate kinase 2 (PPK2 family)
MASEADDNGTSKMKRKAYEAALERLQAELCMLQEWVKYKGLQVIIVFEARLEDSLRQWKLSPTDLESRRRWYDYSRARDRMLEVTDTAHAP